MRETRIIMGMPVTVEIVEHGHDARRAHGMTDTKTLAGRAFDYFTYVDEKFSTYKDASEITAINAGRLKPDDASADMREIFSLAERTKRETDGYFDIVNREGKYDPSGIVKGWAIFNAAKILRSAGAKDFFIDAGGDVQAEGLNASGEPWSVGIADPFRGDYRDVVKVIRVSGAGVATSGTSIRGQHIYDPHKRAVGAVGGDGIYDIVSLTVIGPNIYEADRFATAAFAMGKKGIEFIEHVRLGDGRLEGYQIDKDGMATMTSGFEKFLQ